MSVPKSKQPKKQRRWLYRSSKLHDRHRLLNVLLSKELREKYGKRSVRVRKGDKVRVLRGEFAGHEGKVIEVDLKKSRVKVDGVTITKSDGTEVSIPMHPSNLMILDFGEIDDIRRKILER
ncbi:50S ribosomal protein L24 [Archaeoglobales archaeon]|nr:MAG: 50S ribosomal protein L24 [Archaeoglobales archaeon]